MIMIPANLYGIVETDGDYGKVSSKQFVKSIQCFISFGSGSTSANNQVITQSSTHTALTPDKAIQAGMWLQVDNADYLINAVNPSGRFTILYLQAQGGVNNAD